MARDIYVAIMVAAAHGRGIRLTADEVQDLQFDDAIATCAHNRLTEAELEVWADGGWEKINPNVSGRKVRDDVD